MKKSNIDSPEQFQLQAKKYKSSFNQQLGDYKLKNGN